MLNLIWESFLFFISGLFSNLWYGIFFLSFVPSKWIYLFKKDTDKGIFIGSQIVRLLFGAVYAFLIYDLFLVEHTFTAFFSCFVWIIALFHIAEGLIGNYIGRDNYVTQIIQVFVGALVFIGVICFQILHDNFLYEELGMLPNVTEVSGDTLEELDRETVPLNTKETAAIFAERQSSSLESSSYYNEEEIRLSNINGELTYTASLEFASNVKANKKEKTPGFYTVSATNPDTKAKFHEQEMIYNLSNLFEKNLYRKLREEYPKVVFDDTNTEVDDSGKGYFVTSFGHYEYDYSGFVVDGIFVTDPKTGETTKYDLDKVPSWIDQVYSKSVAETYFEYWGVRKVGYHEARRGEDTYVPGKVITMFNNEKEIVYVTYFTRPNNSKGGMTALGIMNAKTGKISIYKNLDGLITGGKAVEKVKTNILQQKPDWKGAYPTPHKIYGELAYTVPVFEKSGDYIGLAIAKADGDNEMVVFSTDANEAYELYKQRISEKGGNSVIPSEEKLMKQTTGKVFRIRQKNESGWIFLLEGNKTYFSVKTSDEIVLTEPGDTIEIEYYEVAEDTMPVNEFKNLSLQQ